MGNGQNQRGCFWQLSQCCGSEEDELCPSLLSRDKKKNHEINQTSEVIEYRFQASSDPASEVPSEYHSDSEETEVDEMPSSTGGEMGERQRNTPPASQRAIAVDSPSHSGNKWRLIPSTNLKHAQNSD